MMNDLEQILKDYAALETEINEFSSDLWFQWCSDCAEVCCKKVYCRETSESPFLILLLQKHYADPFFHLNHKGWLSEAGCKLTVGRPPVKLPRVLSASFTNTEKMGAIFALCSTI